MQDRFVALTGSLPGRDVEELVIVAKRLTFLSLGLGPEVASAGLATMQGVDAHQFTELEEVSDPSGTFESPQ